jgi:hypothetical protein
MQQAVNGGGAAPLPGRHRPQAQALKHHRLHHLPLAIAQPLQGFQGGLALVLLLA